MKPQQTIDMKDINIKGLTDQELVNLTVAALNDGRISAMIDAGKARQEAVRRGNQVLIDKIDELWNLV